MAVWPASLPQQLVGTGDQDQDAVLRTPMDAGPPTQRNRFSAIVRNLTVPMILTGTQRQTFDTFFRTELKNGSLRFDWEDPVTDATVTMRFLKPPKWKMSRGGNPATRVFRGSLDLEIQP